MAASDWLTDEFLASVRRRVNAPISSESWNAAAFLAMATDEMRDSVVPMIRRINEEFLVDIYDVSTVSGTAAYPLPEWATGEALRDVMLSDGQGGFYSLIRREPDDVSATGNYVEGQFYLQDDSVMLVPTPTAVTTLRMKCIRRPSKLIEKDEAFGIASIASAVANVSLLDSTGSNAQTTLGATANVDVIRATPGFRILGSNLAVTISTNAITFTGGNVVDVAPGAVAGDYICLTGRSPVPQIPAELHGLLAQQTACAYLRASLQPGLGEAQAKLDVMRSEAVGLLTPRTQNQARKVFNAYGAGMGRRTRLRRL